MGFAAAAGCLFVVASTASSTAAAAPSAPEAVSPAAGWGEALVEARCPAFSWAGVEGARGYELVVFAVAPEGPESAGEPVVVSRARLSPGARSWTPSLGNCLERGGRYAWSVRAVTEAGEGAWSEPAIFRVAAGPSVQEVEAAMETLRRHLGQQQAAGGPAAALATDGFELPLTRPDERLRARLGEPEEHEPEAPDRPALVSELRAVARASRSGEETPASPELALAAAPVLASPSLSVSSDIALGAASNLFKAGSVFLWDDTSGNTALGREALASATGNATNNTAFGREALRNTEAGGSGIQGSYNTAVGDQALRSNTTGFGNTATGDRALYSNTTGFGNTASGYRALYSNTTGYGTATGDRALYSNTTGIGNNASGSHALFSNTTGFRNTASGDGALSSNTIGYRNTASGAFALSSNTTGSYNTAIGYEALTFNPTGSRNTAVGHYAGGNATTGDDNIFLGSGAFGSSADTHTIRIGGTTGTGEGQQSRTFIAGIHGTTVTGTGVLVGSDGQLGVASSSERFKEAVEDLGELGERVAALRPVTFRYRSEVLPDGGRQVGLLAEEVAELFPELVALDVEGRPFSVRYDLLSVLLLNELQRAERELEAVRDQGLIQAEQQRTELLALRDRLTAVEQGRPPGRSAVPWWRRQGGGGRDAP